jgi:hypothetical protein
MWVTNNYLEDGFRVLRAWGFRYVTKVEWIKDKAGLGQYFRGMSEPVSSACAAAAVPHARHREAGAGAHGALRAGRLGVARPSCGVRGATAGAFTQAGGDAPHRRARQPRPVSRNVRAARRRQAGRCGETKHPSKRSLVRSWKPADVYRPIGSRNVLLYDGPSQLTGARILVIATAQNGNRKIGHMLQLWIVPAISPIAAVKSGADDAVCGDCRHRGDGHGAQRSCYVEYWRAVENIWQARAKAIPMSPQAFAVKHPGLQLRIGAYGDPVAVPVRIWRYLLSTADGFTAYTHAWRRPQAHAYQDFCMASVDTLPDKRKRPPQVGAPSGCASVRKRCRPTRSPAPPARKPATGPSARAASCARAPAAAA